MFRLKKIKSEPTTLLLLVIWKRSSLTVFKIGLFILLTLCQLFHVLNESGVWGKVDRFTGPILAPPHLNNQSLLKWSLLLLDVPVHYFFLVHGTGSPSPPPPIPLSKHSHNAPFIFFLLVFLIFVLQIGALHAVCKYLCKVCKNMSLDLCYV
jgi:hypothetical protein